MDNTAYTAALTTAACYTLPEPGLLRIAGADRAAFIQRQTTNDIRRLSAGRFQVSVLTNPAARILDVFHLLADDETLLALTLTGNSAVTTAYLKSRIFFMDKVTLTDQSADSAQVELVGPAVAPILQHLGIPEVPGELQVLEMEISSVPVRLLGAAPGFHPGLRLLAPAESLASLHKALREVGVAGLSTEHYDLLRIEAGLPTAGRELTDAYTPLEAGLDGAISGAKGCYTGQEVIARQLTYDKVTQRLCGIRLEKDTPAGVRLWADGKPAGTLTSSAVSPRFGAIGLAIVKRPHDQPGVLLAAGETPEDGVPGIVSALPFP
jgi:folate-binding protein YgfZ